MSADSHTTCPKCYSDLPPDIWWREESTEVRENIEYYWRTQPDGLHLVFEYRADCWECGWHYDTILSERIET